MRLIDADALLERVWSEKIQAQAHGREFSTCFMSPGGTPSTEWWYVEDLIENAPSIEPEPKWIPCSERLPEDSSPVLITHRGGVSYGWYNGRYFERGANTNHRELRTVIAWMPLPEPYRGEGENE